MGKKGPGKRGSGLHRQSSDRASGLARGMRSARSSGTTVATIAVISTSCRARSSGLLRSIGGDLKIPTRCAGRSPGVHGSFISCPDRDPVLVPEPLRRGANECARYRRTCSTPAAPAERSSVWC